jgi:hypothetical protein
MSSALARGVRDWPATTSCPPDRKWPYHAEGLFTNVPCSQGASEGDGRRRLLRRRLPSRSGTLRRRMRRLLPLLIVALLAACGEDEADAPDAPAPTATAAPAETAEPAGGVPFVGSLTVDPGDGTLIAGTGLGMFRVEAGAKRAQPFDGELTTPSGAGAISPNLVLRFSGPGELIGSGHPKDAASGLPENLGLIRSEDGGASWESVSLLGEEDLHALDVRGDVIAGQPVEAASVLVSTDGGRSFEERTPPSAPLDVDLDPEDPRMIAITTAEGLFVSRDGGRSWRQRDVLTIDTHLAWSETGALYRVDASGMVQVSDDGGESWEQAGNAGGPPTTVTVDSRGRLYVALAGARIVRSEDGGRSFEEFVRLG